MRLGPFFLAFASLTLLAAGAEVILRVRHAHKLDSIRARNPDHDLCTEADPDLVYRYVAGRCGYNSRNFRDEDRAATPAPGMRRFAVIGDSVAVGNGIEIDERFDRVVERLLADDGMEAEAVNLARGGYSTSQELMVLEREAAGYHPDAIVWSYVLNDPADPVFHNANGRLGRYFNRPSVHVTHGLRKLFFKTRERIAELRCGDEFHILMHCAYAEQVSAHIARIGAFAREYATPTIFVIHPVFEHDRDFSNSSFASIHASLSRDARKAGLVVVDLGEAYGDLDPRSLQQMGDRFDPWHPNALGHELAAEAIAPVLREALSGNQNEARDGRGQAEGDGGSAQ